MTDEPVPASKATHLTLLIICATLLIVARLSRVEGGQQVTVSGVRLPSVCALRNIAGIDCAGCGLTRAFVSIMHGQWARSFEFHHLGIPTFLFVVAQLLYRLARLTGNDLGAWGPRLGWLADRTLIALIVIGLLDWGVRMARA